jgi:hypothetical protein
MKPANTCIGLLLVAAILPGSGDLQAATMYSTKDTYMGPGTFWGPGPIEATRIFDVVIPNIGFSSRENFVTPFRNNGGAEPNICGEKELGGTPRGTLSDGVTKLNEQVNTCTFELNGVKMLVGVVDGGPHNGRQVATTLDDGTMIMTMDFALDLGIGKSGIVVIPFYGTTAEVTVPYSLQTQLGLEGGVDKAGELASGSKLRGRYGDFDHDGMLDGAIVLAGVMPLSSIFMPGAPYALIRNFTTDVPYDGKKHGRLPGPRYREGEEPAVVTIIPPAEPARASNDPSPAKSAAGGVQ